MWSADIFFLKFPDFFSSHVTAVNGTLIGIRIVKSAIRWREEMDTLYVNGYRLLQVSCDIHDLYTLGFDDNIDMTAHVRNSPAGIAGTIFSKGNFSSNIASLRIRLMLRQ
jgi:hypothetical protein